MWQRRLEPEMTCSSKAMLKEVFRGMVLVLALSFVQVSLKAVKGGKFLAVLKLVGPFLREFKAALVGSYSYVAILSYPKRV
eukprot:648036-Pelagomonas_calceolata.AAC.1